MKCPRAESARQAGPAGAIDVSADASAVGAAMARLSDRDRALIYRAHYLGRTTSQIAAEFRTRDDLVKHDLHRALHALRTGLQEGDETVRDR